MIKINNNYKISNTVLIILIVSFILSLGEVYPIIYTTFFPRNSYGNTYFGKIHNYLQSKYKTDYLSWIMYIVFFCTLIYIITKKSYNIWLKSLLIFICILMIILPVYPILTLLNIYLESKISNPPYIYDYYLLFPQSKNIENNYQTILKEYNNYELNHNNEIHCLRELNPGFKIENRLKDGDSNCWRTIYLKKIGFIQEDIVKYFPNTSELLKDEQIHNAFFSILDPEVEIFPHTGYYKGYLRYHLGVKIPEENNKKPYIVVDNIKYEWSNGKGIVFDDMYLHYVKNPTNKRRVVLYLDIKRKELSNFDQKLIEFGYSYISSNPIIQNIIKNQHTQINLD